MPAGKTVIQMSNDLIQFDKFAVNGKHYRVFVSGFWAVGSGSSQVLMLDVQFFPLSKETDGYWLDHSELLTRFSSEMNRVKIITTHPMAKFLARAIVCPIPKAKIEGVFEANSRQLCLLMATVTYLELPDDLAHRIIPALFEETLKEFLPKPVFA